MAEYDRRRAYRERLRQGGKKEILVAVSLETLAVLESVQAAEGYANRGETIDALVKPITEAPRREGTS